MRPYPPAGSVRSNGFSRSPFFARLDALGLAYTYRGKEAPQ
ncbi:MAG: hypothetical protein PHY79_24755 [Anaerolineae bacterium]|nr:hypothetical protein [Anaerolineae bacterium]